MTMQSIFLLATPLHRLRYCQPVVEVEVVVGVEVVAEVTVVLPLLPVAVFILTLWLHGLLLLYTPIRIP